MLLIACILHCRRGCTAPASMAARPVATDRPTTPTERSQQHGAIIKSNENVNSLHAPCSQRPARWSPAHQVALNYHLDTILDGRTDEPESTKTDTVRNEPRRTILASKNYVLCNGFNIYVTLEFQMATYTSVCINHHAKASIKIMHGLVARQHRYKILNIEY